MQRNCVIAGVFALLLPSDNVLIMAGELRRWSFISTPKEENYGIDGAIFTTLLGASCYVRVFEVVLRTTAKNI